MEVSLGASASGCARRVRGDSQLIKSEGQPTRAAETPPQWNARALALGRLELASSPARGSQQFGRRLGPRVQAPRAERRTIPREARRLAST